MTAMALSVAVTVFGFGVPFRGSLLALLAISSAYLAVMLALGLLISTLGEKPVRRESSSPDRGVPAGL